MLGTSIDILGVESVLYVKSGFGIDSGVSLIQSFLIRSSVYFLRVVHTIVTIDFSCPETCFVHALQSKAANTYPIRSYTS